jgi:NAD(P)-dependent dehydrogenase (short-subunit alcohol dehydrogenase family)
MTLRGKNVVITGADGGLGSAVLEAFLAAGAHCHLPLRKANPALTSRERVTASAGVDLTDEGAVTRFYASCPPLWASVHLVGGFRMGKFLETSIADLQGQWNINLVTAFLCCREALRQIQRSSAGGRLVNVTSRAAFVPDAGSVAYTLSKAGVSALTQVVADAAKGSGVLVNAVAPSIIDTAANRAAMPKAPHDKWPKPAEIAATILYLASPENALTSGAIVPVYGEV